MAKSAAFNILFGANTKRLDKALTHSSKKIRAFSQKMTRIGGSLSRSVTLPLVGLGAAGLKAASEMETLQTSFVSLAGGVKEAGDLMARLNKFTASTPFQLENVANAARGLIASGVGVEEVGQKLQFLGDIAATTGKPIEQISSIFAKVNAKGKVELENLNSLADAGVPIFEKLAEATGLPASELGAGAVSVEQFNATLQNMAAEGGFAAGAMNRLSQTASGRMSTALDNLKFAGAALMESLLPVLKEAIDFVTRFAQAFTGLSDGTKKTILIVAGLLGAAGPIATAVGAIIPIIGGISAPVLAVGAAVAGLAFLIVRNFDIVEPAIISVANAVIQFQNKTKILGVIFSVLKTGLIGFFKFLENGFIGLVDLVGSVGTAVSRALEGDFEGAAGAIRGALERGAERDEAWATQFGADMTAAINDAMNAEDIELLQPGALSGMAQNIVNEVQGIFSGGGTGGGGGGGESVAPVAMGNEGSVPGSSAGGASNVGGLLSFLGHDLEADKEQLEAMALKAEQVAERTRAAFEQVGGAIKNSLSQAFDIVMEGGENMKENLNRLGGELLKSLMKIAIGNAIAAAFSPLAPDNAATGGIAGIAKSALLQSLIPGMMPALRNGGLAFGPTMAVVGDNPGAGIDPEVIAPLSKLRSMMGPQAGSLSARVSGRDLLLVGRRDRNRGRRTYGSAVIA